MGDVVDLGDELLDLRVRLLLVLRVHILKLQLAVQLLHALDLLHTMVAIEFPVGVRLGWGWEVGWH